MFARLVLDYFLFCLLSVLRTCFADYFLSEELRALYSYKSQSGQIHFFRGRPIAWRPQRQAMKPTYESEHIALSDSLLIPGEVCAVSKFLSGADEMSGPDGAIWCDNRSVIVTVRKPAEVDIGRKSRHVAIRLAKVREIAAELLVFAPTNCNARMV